MIEISDTFRKQKTMSSSKSWTDPYWLRRGGKFHHRLSIDTLWDCTPQNLHGSVSGCSVSGCWVGMIDSVKYTSQLLALHPKAASLTGVLCIYNTLGKDAFWGEYGEGLIKITHRYSDSSGAFVLAIREVLLYVPRPLWELIQQVTPVIIQDRIISSNQGSLAHCLAPVEWGWVR